MDLEVRQSIESHINAKDVVLFMKGTRGMPQCGFSATVVQILDSLVSDYSTVNVLADSTLRNGIKEFSDWPTIPQLYIKGEFVGGCDIIKDMYESGQLEPALGVEAQEVAVPDVRLSEAAQHAFKDALQKPDDVIRLEVDGRFNHSLSIGEKSKGDLFVELGALTLAVPRMSAKRANGVSIDFVDSEEGKAFKITNPNEPPKVQSLSVEELKKRLLQAEDGLRLYDVRTPNEREIAHVEGSKLLDRGAQDEIMGLPKETALYFYCHHGQRSEQAAQFFLNQGFLEVYNVEGGIDAWARDVDTDIARY